MKPIEKLVLWLIPAELLGVVLHAVFTFVSINHSISHGPNSLASTFQVLSGLSYLVGQAVIGIWLFNQSHQSKSRRYIWFIFGLATGFWALGIYLLMQIPSVRQAIQSGESSTSPALNA